MGIRMTLEKFREKEIVISEKLENVDEGCIKIGKNKEKIIPKPFLTDTCVDKETLLHKNLKNLENLEKSLDKNMSMKGK
jgi:hypothetical protein